MKLNDIYKKIDSMNEQASMNISMSGETADDVGKLLRMMKDAGLEKAEPVSPDLLSPGDMRGDIDKFKDIVDKGDGPEGPPSPCGMDAPEPDGIPDGGPDGGPDGDIKGMDIIKLGGIGDGDKDSGDDGDAEKETDYANQPDETYGDTELMPKDLAGGLNGPKKSYPKVAGGDNPMAIRAELTRLENNIKSELAASLSEKMSGDK